jgi:hypothetical protein
MILKPYALYLALLGMAAMTGTASAGTWIYGNDAPLDIVVKADIALTATSTNWTIDASSLPASTWVATVSAQTTEPVTSIGFKWVNPGSDAAMTTMNSGGGGDTVAVKWENVDGTSVGAPNPDGYFLPSGTTTTSGQLNVQLVSNTPVVPGSYTAQATAAYYL